MPHARNTPGGLPAARPFAPPASARRLAIGAVAAFALMATAAGCAARPAARVAEIPFQCEDGRRFTAMFSRNPDLAVVRVQGSELPLPGNASSASGAPAHYDDGRNALSGSGSEATLQLEGMPPSHGCVRMADAPPPRPKAKGTR